MCAANQSRLGRQKRVKLRRPIYAGLPSKECRERLVRVNHVVGVLRDRA